MKISVIIPSYNRKEFLPRVIKSTLGQTYQNLEIIVVDDGSTDGTEEVMVRYKKNELIKYLKLDANQGVHNARNKGLESATGDYICFIDSDDELSPDAFSEAVPFFSQDHAIAIVSSPFIDDSGESTSFVRSSSGYLSFEDQLCQRGAHKKKTGLVIIRRSFIGIIRFVAPNLDFIFFRRVAKQGKWYFINKPLGRYHDENTAYSMTTQRKIPDINLSIKRARALDNYIEEFKNDYIKYCPSFLSMYSYGAAVGLLLDNKKARALHYARLMVRYNPRRIKYIVFLFFTLLPFSPNLLRWLFCLKKFVIMKNLKK